MKINKILLIAFLFFFSLIQLNSQQIKKIQITSNPPGVKVLFGEGKEIGTTPFEYAFRIGRSYPLTFMKSGYLTQSLVYICDGRPIHVNMQGAVQRKLTVNSNVYGSSVFINNNEMGKTPCVLSLAPDTYNLAVKYPGYADYTTSVNLFSDQVINANLTQTIRNARLTVNSNINQASVLINNQERGRTPCTIELAQGNYNILVRYPGYSDYNITINLSSDMTINANLTQIIKNAKLTVTSNIHNANVFINNEERGRTPCTIELAQGTYNVTVRYAGYSDYSITVNLDRNQNIHASLNISNYKLTVTSNINSASVLINNMEHGKTPCTIDLAPGTYNVTVRYAGYSDYNITVNLDRNQNIHASLNISSYKLTINSNIQNAIVYINNQEKGRTPLTIMLQPGNYAVLVKFHGHREYSVNINLTSDLTINADLVQKKTFKINLPKDAKIWIDGVLQASTPGINTFYLDSQSGQYAIKIQYFDLVYEDKIQSTGNDNILILQLDLKQQQEQGRDRNKDKGR